MSAERTPPPQPAPQPKVTLKPAPPAPVASTSATPVTPMQRAPVGPAKLSPNWEHDTVGQVLNVTLDVWRLRSNYLVLC